MKTLIIQSSFPRSASTVLVNAVHGMIPSLADKKVEFSDFYRPFRFNLDITIIKTHQTELDDMIHRYSGKYKLFFICSERAGFSRFNDKYRLYKNVVIFDFKELNETPNNILFHIVDHIYNKIQPLLVGIELDRISCYERLDAMNIRYEEIKYLPFDYVDSFYNIHGNHRNRPR
jgi:hypothetical protein